MDIGAAIEKSESVEAESVILPFILHNPLAMEVGDDGGDVDDDDEEEEDDDEDVDDDDDPWR